jgi:hypothetical protein
MRRPRTTRPISTFLPAAGLGLCCLLAAGPAPAGDPVFGGNTAQAVLGADEPMRGRQLDDVDLSFVIDNDIINDVLEAGPTEAELACAFFAQNGGEGRKGVKVRFSGTVTTPDEGTQQIPSTNQRTRRSGYAYATWDLDADEPAEGEVRVNVNMNPSGGKQADVWGGVCRVGAWIACQADDTTLCLDGGRFQVTADWRDFDGSTGPGMVQSNPSDISGSFYFFNPNNPNLIVDLLDMCKNNNFFWVFASASTDVEYTLKIEDTHTGTSKEYLNPLGQPAQAVTDTRAFDTCP